MRKLALLTLIVLAVACQGIGCLKLPSQQATKQNLANWELFAPAHKWYLDADKMLSADSKRIRKRTLDDSVSLARKLAGEGNDE